MAKPIGNQVANMKTNDKVGFRTREKFANKALLPSPAAPTPEANAAKKPVKYKTRKK